MTARERTQQWERETLSPHACRAEASRGRARPVEPCPMRTAFQRDVDRVVHCKAFRRLMHKTQVFLSPEGDHYRTRMTHTLEVSRIARTIARGLRLNEDLTEAAALGHDLGHTPFGHAGERVLSEIMPGGFEHNMQSLRVVERLENDGAGLNLTWEVRNAICCHTGEEAAATLEGRLLRLADQIAYINHDIDDAIRAGILTEEDIPRHLRAVLGHSHKGRINFLVENLICTTSDTGLVGLEPPVADAMNELRSFMFERVYCNPVAKSQEDKARAILQQLYHYYMAHPDRLPEHFRPQMDFDGMERTVCDYIAGMTDKYAIDPFSELFIPQGWQVR